MSAGLKLFSRECRAGKPKTRLRTAISFAAGLMVSPLAFDRIAFCSGREGEHTITGHSKKESLPECTLLIRKKGRVATLAYSGSAGKFALELDIPRQVRVTKPVYLSCQQDRTIIVTKDYVIRTLGYENLRIGIEMLGFMYNPQERRFIHANAVFMPTAPLGPVLSAIAEDNVLQITSATGTYAMDTDKPHRPAKQIDR